MPAVACPHCRTELALDAEGAGELVECAACGRRFPAAAGPPPANQPWRNAPGPPPRASRYDDHRRGQYDDYADRVRRQRSWPYRDHDDPPERLVRHAREQCHWPVVGLTVIGMVTLAVGLWVVMVWVPQLGEPDWLATGYGVYSVLVGGFWVYAAVQMRQAKQYGVCLVACVMLLPGVSPCCVLGTIFGITGLGKLNDPRVRLGFRANRPGYDPDND